MSFVCGQNNIALIKSNHLFFLIDNGNIEITFDKFI
jgi:hypothetical protein